MNKIITIAMLALAAAACAAPTDDGEGPPHATDIPEDPSVRDAAGSTYCDRAMSETNLRFIACRLEDRVERLPASCDLPLARSLACRRDCALWATCEEIAAPSSPFEPNAYEACLADCPFAP